MKTILCAISKRKLALPIALTLLTISLPATASESLAKATSNESNESGGFEESTTIDFPVGRTSKDGKEKCFSVEAYKSLAIIYAHYTAYKSQRSYVFDLMAAADEKRRALQKSADDLRVTLATLERERDAMVIAATTNAERAEIEERRKRAWRGFAIGGLVVSLALGGVITVMGVVK